MIVDVAKSSLETHHASLENKLLEELKRPQPDQNLIVAIKKKTSIKRRDIRNKHPK